MARPLGSGRDTVATSIRLTRTAKQLLDDLAMRAGLSQAGMMETLIRAEARREAVMPPEDSDEKIDRNYPLLPLPGGEERRDAPRSGLCLDTTLYERD